MTTNIEDSIEISRVEFGSRLSVVDEGSQGSIVEELLVHWILQVVLAYKYHILTLLIK
jgi:hypothetical protein